MRRASSLTLAAIAALSAAVSGCGPDCQSSCQKMFSQNECNLQRPGVERETLLGECEDRCERALENPGDADPDYNPGEKAPPSSDTESTRFETDVEAAMWMDCIEETACDLIDDGYCWGIGL